jgi:hypothetical protein
MWLWATWSSDLRSVRECMDGAWRGLPFSWCFVSVVCCLVN